MCERLYRRQLTDKEAGKMNLSFSTDDEFYKAISRTRTRTRRSGTDNGKVAFEWNAAATQTPIILQFCTFRTFRAVV